VSAATGSCRLSCRWGLFKAGQPPVAPSQTVTNPAYCTTEWATSASAEIFA